MKPKQKGYLSVILSAVIFGCMPVMARFIYSGGGNALSLVFYRSLFALPALYLLMRKTEKESIKISGKILLKITVMVGFGLALTPVFLFSSYNYIPSGTATTIHFVYPVLVLLGCSLFFREKIGPVKLLCVLICTAGITMLCDLKAGGQLPGILLAFFSGVTYAFYIIYLDKSNLKSMGHFKLGFYSAVITSALLLGYTVCTGSLTLDMTAPAWGMSVLFANLVTVGAVVLFQIGVRKVGPQNAAILSTFEPLTSLLSGVLFLGEAFSLRTCVGVVLILASVTILTRSDSKADTGPVENP